MTNFYNRATILWGQSRHDLAERELRQSLAENPNHAASYALLGICLLRLNRPVEALEAANEALRLDPTLAYAHHARGYVLVQTRNRLRQAEKDLEAAIELEPSNPGHFCTLAALYCDQRRSEQSLAAAERCLELDPRNTECASLRALALQRLGRAKQAEAAIAQALSLNPNSDFTHAAQGWRLLERNDRKRARRHFLEALRINPNNRWARSGLESAKPVTVLVPTTVTIVLIMLLRFVSQLYRHDTVVHDAMTALVALVVLVGSAAVLVSIRDSRRRRV
jgi:tetratricopeptide (TPR) repeat protein